MHLKHSDYRRLNEAVALMYRRAFSIGAAAAISETLVQLLGGVNAVAGSLRGPQVVAFSATNPVFARLLITNTSEIARNHPRFRRHDLAGDVVVTSDLLTEREWASDELFGPGWKSLPYGDDLGVNKMLSNGNVISTAVMRERRTFRQEHREMFALLLPHIETLFSPLPEHDASALAGIGLTKREQQVLFWVSEAKANSEIAVILGIARGTVKRHLENIYHKLGVENRHGAARRAIEKLRPFG
jgi:DNA-binding CsgD family transcriptional regulator